LVESTFLNVGCGDAILIRYKGDSKNYVNILMDGGYVKTYQRVLKPHLEKIRDRNEKIDLLILTHYDSDHIGGILAFIRDKDFDHSSFVDLWWSNIDIPLGTPSGNISIPQLLTLKNFLLSMGKTHDSPIINNQRPFDLDGAKLTILSPDVQNYLLAADSVEEAQKTISGATDSGIPVSKLIIEVMREADHEQSISNGSSIAILLQIGQANFLLLSDAYHSVVSEALNTLGYGSSNRLNLNWLKVSHHGSRTNTSNALLNCLDCTNFVLSVNGNNRSGLPHKHTLVRILKNGFRKPETPFNFYFTHNDAALNELFLVDPAEIVSNLNFNFVFPDLNNALTINTPLE
jgi:beta-lactamase superfamily II metal-dependent hydrolase